MKKKPILCLDFDGVLHSYMSGWKGPEIIPDPPVPGAIRFILDAMEHFEVHIFSSRSSWDNGIDAMKAWLQTEATKYLHSKAGLSSESLHNFLLLVDSIHFPREKPPAFLTIDDRAICFRGEWPEIKDLRDFKPWYAR